MNRAETALEIEWPWDGDVLNRHDGDESGGGLRIEVSGRAWPGARISAAGESVTAGADGRFALPAVLTEREQKIVVTAEGPARVEQAEIMLLWDRQSRPRYRFSSDDNILFLRDLAQRPDEYASLFDHWYLALWREMHERYGTKVHINIYFSDGQGFTLEKMPDKWKGEWQKNADWLHLSFHARENEPNRIYRRATYEELSRDIERVHQQIVRFAGEEVLPEWTTLHWAECPRDAARALRDAGYRGLIILARRPCEQCTTMYYLGPEHCEHIIERDAWKDFDMDLLFVQCDMVVNTVPLEEIVPRLEIQADNPHTGELLELLIHEQYFREDLPRYYQPDVKEKVETAIKFAAERGYEPVFWADELL